MSETTTPAATTTTTAAADVPTARDRLLHQIRLRLVCRSLASFDKRFGLVKTRVPRGRFAVLRDVRLRAVHNDVLSRVPCVGTVPLMPQLVRQANERVQAQVRVTCGVCATIRASKSAVGRRNLRPETVQRAWDDVHVEMGRRAVNRSVALRQCFVRSGRSRELSEATMCQVPRVMEQIRARAVRASLGQRVRVQGARKSRPAGVQRALERVHHNIMMRAVMNELTGTRVVSGCRARRPQAVNKAFDSIHHELRMRRVNRTASLQAAMSRSHSKDMLHVQDDAIANFIRLMQQVRLSAVLRDMPAWSFPASPKQPATTATPTTTAKTTTTTTTTTTSPTRARLPGKSQRKVLHELLLNHVHRELRRNVPVAI